MLKDCGCAYVIPGYSERRADHGESSAEVAAKATGGPGGGPRSPSSASARPTSQRDAGETLKVVESQIVNSIPQGSTAANLVVAYEPVWAIGTGRTPTSGDVEVVHRPYPRSWSLSGVRTGRGCGSSMAAR